MKYNLKNFTRDPNCLGYIVLYGASSGELRPVDLVNDKLKDYSFTKYIQSEPSAKLVISRAVKELLSINNRNTWTTIDKAVKELLSSVNNEVARTTNDKAVKKLLSSVKNKVTQTTIKAINDLLSSVKNKNARATIDKAIDELLSSVKNKDTRTTIDEALKNLLSSVKYKATQTTINEAINELLSSVKSEVTQTTIRAINDLLLSVNNKDVQTTIDEVVKDLLSSVNNEVARTTIDKKEIIIRIYKEEFGSTNHIIYKRDTKLVYDKGYNKISATGSDVVLFDSLFKKYRGKLTGDDLRLLSREIVEELPFISLRGGKFVKDAGGVYYVPKDKIDILEALRNVLENLQVGYVKAFCIIDGESERAEIFKASIDFYTKQIESYMRTVKRITSRISTLKAIQKKLSVIEKNVILYTKLTRRKKINKDGVKLNSYILRCIEKINEKIKKIEEKKKKKLSS